MINPIEIRKREAGGGTVTETAPGAWTLHLPAGPAGTYRWAQLDDYLHLPRRRFPWHLPLHMEMRARISDPNHSGTWGFGFWNDPFNLSLGVGGTARRFPALPDTAWFFFASPPNYLAFHDDHPAQGFLTATFSSRPGAAALLPFGLPALPLLAFPPAARLLRRAAAKLIREAAATLTLDPTRWHHYSLHLQPAQAAFLIDGQTRFETPVVPRGQLGFVLWIDNQYAAFRPDGRLASGTLKTEQAVTLEVADLTIQPGLDGSLLPR